MAHGFADPLRRPPLSLLPKRSGVAGWAWFEDVKEWHVAWRKQGESIKDAIRRVEADHINQTK